MFTISSERAPGYLRIVAQGPAGVPETCATASFCAELLRRTGLPRVLIDMHAFVPEFVQADGLEVLSALYGQMPPLERIAVVAPVAGSHGLVIDVARHRGVAAREFDDLGQAEAWLREDPGS